MLSQLPLRTRNVILPAHTSSVMTESEMKILQSTRAADKTGWIEKATCLTSTKQETLARSWTAPPADLDAPPDRPALKPNLFRTRVSLSGFGRKHNKRRPPGRKKFSRMASKRQVERSRPTCCCCYIMVSGSLLDGYRI